MALPGSLGKRDAVCSPGNEAGHRRTIGVVAALPINPHATTPMARRWVAGTPMRPGGPEGRCQPRIGTPPPAGTGSTRALSAHVRGEEPTRIGTPPSPAGRRRYKHRSALSRAPVPGAIEPTRIGTPPSPAGRRRYKHRSALCRAHVSWVIEPTRIGTPPSPAGRRRYKHRSALCRAHVSWAMEPTRIVNPPGGPLRSAVPASKQSAGMTELVAPSHSSLR